MALASAARACAIHNLDLRCMIRTPTKYIFLFCKSHISWRKDASFPQLVFHEISEDPELCFVKAIDGCLAKSKYWRTEAESELLNSFIKTHKEVASLIVSSCLKIFLSLAGIDTKKFKGHSTQSA